MKSKQSKKSRKLRNINCMVFLYNNTTRICIARTYSDGTIDEEERFTNESLDKFTANLSNMSSKSLCITVYNFKEYDYYK